MYQYCFSSAGRGNGRGVIPFLTSLALEHEIVIFAWIDNVSVQFPCNIYGTKGLIQLLDCACSSARQEAGGTTGRRTNFENPTAMKRSMS